MLKPERSPLRSAHPAGGRTLRALSVTTRAPTDGPRGAERVDVAIVGGGASGALSAIHLLASRAHGLDVGLFESSGVLGAGLAYGTTDRRHLLNVRSRHMSAFPDIPGDLVEWARATGREPDALAFLPRCDYADYLNDTLERFRDHRLSVFGQRVRDVVPANGGFDVHSGRDSVLRATTVLLALGNPPPAPLEVDGEPLPSQPWHVRNPWQPERLDVSPRATVVLIGTGLSAVDTAITLLEDAPERRVLMVSRRGLMPARHIDQISTGWLCPIPDGPLTADGLARLVRQQASAARRQGVDWRSVVDGLRPRIQGLWRRLDVEERRRFVATYARDWEVRRHRMAPDVAARLDRYRAEGRLQVAAGGISRVDNHGRRCTVHVPGLREPVYAEGVVNCTGPLGDVTRSTDPLVIALLGRGLLAPDPLRLGVSCTVQGEVRDADGEVVEGLYVIGPARRGSLWESTAVPEIRGQASALATLLPERIRAAS